jgi:hypothetical protein
MRGIVAAFTFVVIFSASSYLYADSWFIIKDSKGICKVIQAKEKTPKTVSGPYKTEADADKVKDKVCQEASKKSKWFIIQDVNDVCRVIEADDKTPKTIAGPFSSEEEAEKAKEKACVKKKKK